MSGRGQVRSSARLGGDSGPASAGVGPTAAAAGRGRPRAAAASEAAQRRARAAERAREVEDSPRVLRDKCRRLARALRNAKHLVVYTGAGISTAADIPDYRGPRGVWTRLQRGEPVGRVEVARARPTFTHMALTALWARGALKFVVSQNCDGLHVRAGLPRRALAELHGDMFCERCAACRAVYLRAFDTTERTARHRHATRRLCHACGAELRDSIVHFGERGRARWPLNWAGALRHAARADVVLCLGSSLKVLRRYPRLWRMQAPRGARPALYIVNLQWTPKDAGAALKINARCDAVMRQVARRLRLPVPRYRAGRDPLLAHAEPLAAPERHTTRRAPLSPPPAPSPPPSDDSEPASPSASDSDEELPLRRLADRLRAPAPGPPTLSAFQVRLATGDATILLRARDASPAPAPAPAPAAPLRAFRMARRGAADGPASAALRLASANGDLGSRLRSLLECGPRLCVADDADADAPAHRVMGVLRPPGEGQPKSAFELEPKSEWKPEPRAEWKSEPKSEVKLEPKSGDSTEGEVEAEAEAEAEAGSLAAAIIRRAVLLCRAQLYPGLHSIIAPAPAAQCAWCARRYGARRCLWYGPPRLTPLSARAWRKERARRFLCACCGADAPAPAPAHAPAGAADPLADGGWFGKGYRKGRRRR